MSSVTLSNSSTVNALLCGTRWGGLAAGSPAALDYSFPTTGSLWPGYSNPGEPNQGFAVLTTPAERQAVRDVLAAWSAVADITFNRILESGADTGDLRFAYTTWLMDGNQLAYAYLPDDDNSSGDVWLNTNFRDTLFQSLEPGSLGGFTVLHEVGHTLGLKHPGESTAYSTATLAIFDDTLFNTVMSSNVWPGIRLTKAGNIDRLPTTPMSFDIDALQYLYGANTSTHSADDRYTFADTGKYLEVIYDTGGNDTIAIAGTAGGRINLNPGGWSQLGTPVKIGGGTISNPETVQIYRTSLIENAIGGQGNDELTGNDANNRLDGNAGSDTLIGGNGSDTLHGGSGADYFVLDVGSLGFNNLDTITDFSIEEGDRLNLAQILSRFVGNPNQADLFASEHLVLTQQGNNTRIDYDTDGTGTGDSRHELVTLTNIDASSLNNTLFIQGLESSALAMSALGDDILVGSRGKDTLMGFGGDDTLLGKRGRDLLDGGDGMDILDGGRGIDTLIGGNGNDTYLVNNRKDVITEAADQGSDVVHSSSGNYTLANHVEHLTLIGHGANGTGNTLDNHITGNDRGNILKGAAGDDTLNGGNGSDRLMGGAGSDIFVFDSRLKGNIDTILDYEPGTDQLQLATQTFSALTLADANGDGLLDENYFHSFAAGESVKATTATDLILFDEKTGTLYYDADGSGLTSSAVRFAIIKLIAVGNINAGDIGLV